MAKPTYVAGRLTGVAIYELPASFSREIGKIVVRWAYFEHCVQEMNWGVLNLSPAAGRIAIREPRVTDRLQMLQELIALRKGLWDEELYKSILSRARLASAKRDLLAHGIWGRIPETGEWHVQLTRRSWPKNLADIIRGSRKVTPESVPMDMTKLKEATNEILALIEDLKRLRASATDPPSPSPDKLH